MKKLINISALALAATLSPLVAAPAAQAADTVKIPEEISRSVKAGGSGSTAIVGRVTPLRTTAGGSLPMALG